MEDTKIFMKNEVELFRETISDGTFWFVTDCEAGGNCVRYESHKDAVVDYDERVKKRIAKYYTKTAVPFDVQVMPLPKEAKMIQILVDRLNDYERQLKSDYGFQNKQKISNKVKELKKCIQLMQSA